MEKFWQFLADAILIVTTGALVFWTIWSLVG